MTKTRPSPISPVRAAPMMALMASSTAESGTTTSISIFGSRLTSYSRPRYTAVWPFWRPWPRTSVTVMPAILSLPRASLMLSTMLGRTIALISFMQSPSFSRGGPSTPLLAGRVRGPIAPRRSRLFKHPFQIGLQQRFVVFRKLGAAASNVEHVDGFLSLGRDQHQIDVDAVIRNDPADPVQQSRRVVCDQLEHGVALRVRRVEVDDRCPLDERSAREDAAFLALQQRSDVRGTAHYLAQPPVELLRAF